MIATINLLAWLFPSPRVHAPLRMAISQAPMKQMGAKQVGAPPRLKPRAAPAGAAQVPPAPDGDVVRQFQRTMLPHLDAAYSFARLLTRGDAAAEDITHDAYVRALRAFGGYRGGDAKAWLLAIVRNCFLTWAKAKSGGRSGGHLSLDEAADVSEPRETAEAEIVRSEEAQLMQRLIEALPYTLREVIVLREVEELSYREIAAALDIPIGTVMSRLARARTALAEAWKQGEAQP